MKLHDLAPAPGSTKKPIRVGRGRAGRRGKTAGRGQKGAKARGQIALGYEGGQMPLHMRIPKLPGFKNFSRVEYCVVNLSAIDRLETESVDPDLLRSKGLVGKKGPVKVLGQGEVGRPVTVKAQAFSQSAKAKIEAAGGSVEVI
ncbi:MAG TPA: 50S ribosomal protein L15 [Actinomycetota bacterium]|nr:50S ribosomal protein L15 [Actinomycetota bacterium]